MKKKCVLLLIVVALLFATTACSSSIPSAFEEVMSFEEGGSTITQYVGESSLSDAKDDFEKWAKGNGWKKLENGYSFESEEMAGMAFEKGNDKMSITITGYGAEQLIVYIVEGEEAY